MEKYRARSLEDLTETLVILAKRVRAPGLPAELRELVCMLRAQKLRHSSDAHAFCKCGGMKVLVELLKFCEADSRDSIAVLGTIGNLCALNHDSRRRVMDNGLEAIVGFLKTSRGSDCIGTAARVLANLSLDRPSIARLHEHSVVEHLSQLLAQRDTDISCRKNVVRALRLLCRVGECLEELKQNDGLPLLLDCLKSDHVELAVGAVQALEVASATGDLEVLQQLCRKEVMQFIVRLCGNSKPKVKRSAINVLLKSAKVLDGRIALSSAGGVEALVVFLDTVDKRSEIFHEVVCALCTCCRDVISRQHLRDCGGLEKLIGMLADPTSRRLHNCMMAALVCYYFDETTLKLMVTKMKLLQTLSYHLRKMTAHLKEICKEKAEHPEDSGQEQETEMEGESESSDVRMETVESQEETSSQTEEEEEDEEEMKVCPSESDKPSPSHNPSSPPMKGCPSDIDKPSSSDDPSSPPMKRARLDPETDSPLNTTSGSFLDSLLSSPSPYKNASSKSILPPSSPSIAGEKSTFESQVILMVSRMSHMKDCLVSLSYTETLLSILDYFLSSRPPNMHIFKILTRVFMNAHCFQNCITSLVPSRLQQTIRTLDIPPSPESPSGATVLGESMEKEGKGDADVIGLCQGLMVHMSKNAESPYGQGVLAHLLLRGSEKEKQASCLSMPLLCRSPRVCQTLMVDYGAFQVLCELLKDEDDALVWEMAVDSMLALAHNMQKQHVPRHRRRYSALPMKLPAHARKFPFSRLDVSFKDLSLSEPLSLLQAYEPCEGDTSFESSPQYCRYIDTDHHPFNLTFVLHPPSGPAVRVPVHKSTLVEHSDVFRVMLDGSYRESSGGEVHLHSISPCGFLSMIHHLYGCGWKCRRTCAKLQARANDLVEGMDEEGAPLHSDFLSETSDVLLAAIVSGCRDGEEGAKVEHCLQLLACAGRFLLPDLVTLSEHEMVRYLCPGNVVAVFHFAQLHQCFCLSESCLRTLVTLPHLLLRTQVFKQLLTSSEGEAAIQIILLFLTAVDFC